MNTVAGSTLPTRSKALKDSALWFVQKGKSPFDLSTFKQVFLVGYIM